MNRSLPSQIVVTVTTSILTLVLGVSVAGLLNMMERQRPTAHRVTELEYLPKGEYLKVVVLGYRQVMADLIWLKAVQHLGERKQTRAGYRWAYHAVDVLTDLDPNFISAYHAAGTILGVWSGQVQESIAILSKGIRHNPDVWQLPYIMGYDYFYELCDPLHAAEYFRQASLLPGAPAYLPKLAARMTVEGGDPNAALEFLTRFAQQTQDERLREALSHRFKEVMSERDIRFLEEGVQRFSGIHHKLPMILDDLVKAGIIDRVPHSPFGGKYVLSPTDGRISDPGLRERLRVYRHVDCQIVKNSPPTEGPGLIPQSFPQTR